MRLDEHDKIRELTVFCRAMSAIAGQVVAFARISA
jgi:hypothetical protein